MEVLRIEWNRKSLPPPPEKLEYNTDLKQTGPWTLS